MSNPVGLIVVTQVGHVADAGQAQGFQLKVKMDGGQVKELLNISILQIFSSRISSVVS